MQTSFLGQKRQSQIERLGGGGHGSFVGFEPSFPVSDFSLPLPPLEVGLNRGEIRDSRHVAGQGSLPAMQFRGQIEPELVVVPGPLRPEIEALPAISEMLGKQLVEVAFGKLAKVDIGVKILHLSDEAGFDVVQRATELRHQPFVKR